MPGSRAPSRARTQGALGLASPGATEDAAWRRVLAGQAPPDVAGRLTYFLPPESAARGRPRRPRSAAPGFAQPAQPLREGDAPRVDADEGGALDRRVALDDLVRDPVERSLQGVCVEEDALGRRRVDRLGHLTPFRPRRTGLKGHRSAGSLAL